MVTASWVIELLHDGHKAVSSSSDRKASHLFRELLTDIAPVLAVVVPVEQAVHALLAVASATA